MVFEQHYLYFKRDITNK